MARKSRRRRRPPEPLEGEIARLEQRFRESAAELRELRLRFRSRARAEVQAEWQEIRDEWEAVDHKVGIVVAALLVAFFVSAYVFYVNLGWYADQRVLARSSDWFLDQIPTLNLIPLMSWGWLALHAWALGVTLLYTPRRMPFLLFLLGVYLCVRTLYVFLSPIGAPVRMLDMIQLDYLFSQVVGVLTFQNEFVFSGHTAVPFLFALFFEKRRWKAVMLAGSGVMAATVLLTHNHYTVDVISAYFMGYAIWALSRGLWVRAVQPWLRHARAPLPAPRAHLTGASYGTRASR
jgi:hypothetical protein